MAHIFGDVAPNPGQRAGRRRLQSVEVVDRVDPEGFALFDRAVTEHEIETQGAALIERPRSNDGPLLSVRFLPPAVGTFATATQRAVEFPVALEASGGVSLGRDGLVGNGDQESVSLNETLADANAVLADVRTTDMEEVDLLRAAIEAARAPRPNP